MQWPAIDDIYRGLEVPGGYVLDYLSESEVDDTTAKIKLWYPDIKTGAESAHLDPQFLRAHANLKEVSAEREVCVFVVKYGDEIVAFYSMQINPRTHWLAGRLTVISPGHRKQNLGNLCVHIFERVARLIGVGMLWVSATLQHPYTQHALEKCGFQLVGLMPAWDLDCINGKSKYVTEALYAKVLAKESERQPIDDHNLSPKVRKLRKFLGL